MDRSGSRTGFLIILQRVSPLPGKLFPPSTLCTHEYYPHDHTGKLPKTRSGTILRRVLEAKERGLDHGDISRLEI